METYEMQQKLRDKFGAMGLRAAVELHTNYQKWEVKDLDEDELWTLYQRFFPQKTTEARVFELENEKRKKTLRGTILKEASYIGMLEPDNWQNFNQWMLNLSPLKKPLNAYQLDEFKLLIRQFKSLRTKYDRQSQIPYTKEWYHKNKLPMPSEN